MKYIKAYTATWCGPCKMIKKELEKIQENNNIKIENYDIDEFKEEVNALGIKAVPTLLFMEDGEEVTRYSGYLPANKILEKLGE